MIGISDASVALLVKVLDDMSQQLAAARKHRSQLEDMIVSIVRTVEGNSNMLARLDERLGSLEAAQVDIAARRASDRLGR